MGIKLVEHKELWDDFVEKSPYGLLYHMWDFLDVVANSTGYPIERYGIYDGTVLIALFPMFSKNSFGFKTLFSPPPKTEIPYMGFIMGSDYDSLKQNKKEKQVSLIVDSFSNMVNEKKFNYVHICLVPNFLDIRPFKWNSYNVDILFSYSINLSPSLDNILSGFSKINRKQLKIAESYNLFLKRNDNLSMFYTMEVNRYAEQGLNFPIVNQEYLEKLFSQYPENLCLYYLHNDTGNIIGSIITQEYNNRFILWMGNTKIEDNIGGNEFIIWELIKKAKEKNYKFLEIVGANNKNLCQFKSKFNPSLDLYYSITKHDLLGGLVETLYMRFIRKKHL